MSKRNRDRRNRGGGGNQYDPYGSNDRVPRAVRDKLSDPDTPKRLVMLDAPSIARDDGSPLYTAAQLDAGRIVSRDTCTVAEFGGRHGGLDWVGLFVLAGNPILPAQIRYDAYPVVPGTELGDAPADLASIYNTGVVCRCRCPRPTCSGYYTGWCWGVGRGNKFGGGWIANTQMTAAAGVAVLYDCPAADTRPAALMAGVWDAGR